MQEFLEEILAFLSKFEWREPSWEETQKIYRQRALEEIISSGYFLGCYEPAIILYEKATEKGIPARFLEMMDKEKTRIFVSDDGETKIADIVSHCLVELKLNEKWEIVDPTRRKTLPNYPSKYIFFAEGPHNWDSFDEYYEAQKRFILKTFREKKGKIFIY